jgi:hypothetical protein
VGFVQGDGSGNPRVVPTAEDVPRTTEIRVAFDGWLDPASIGPESVIVRSGELERTTTLRWDFQAGPDFDDPDTPPNELFDDQPPHQVVAIRTVTPFDADNQYRIVVTEALRGLFGEPVEPFEMAFSTGAAEGGALPVEPPDPPPGISAFVEGSLWQFGEDCGAEDAPATCRATCGWGAGPCHRLLEDGVAYETDRVDPRYPEPAMDLLLCGNLQPDGSCSTIFEAQAPWKDFYDFSAQWPRMRIVDPGHPESSYLLYKLLGVPGIDGGAMPRAQDTRGHDPFVTEGSPNRSNFVLVARAFRQWIAAGAPAP